MACHATVLTRLATPCPTSIVKLRRIAPIARWAATMLVALVVALAVPVSQLTTAQTVFEKCCCPDPAHCKCPSHEPATTRNPQLVDCHKTSHEVAAPQLPAFAQPVLAFVVPSVQRAALVPAPYAAAHPAPDPRRPDAPA
ncbi:hypothetical protein BH11MYX1_BH11MYX1_19040 [soil metagenome]